MKIGSTLYKIHKNLQITQNELSKGIMTQCAYSKIEKSQLQVNAEQFIQLLLKMNISLNEFTFIMNGYHLDEKLEIIQAFTSLEVVNLSTLQTHLKKIENYVENENDPLIESLSKIYKAFITLQLEKDIMKAQFEECLHLLEQTETNYLQKMSYKSTAMLFESKAICLF